MILKLNTLGVISIMHYKNDLSLNASSIHWLSTNINWRLIAWADLYVLELWKMWTMRIMKDYAFLGWNSWHRFDIQFSYHQLKVKAWYFKDGILNEALSLWVYRCVI